MADTTRLNEALGALSAKVDELIARANQPPPVVDNQAEIDAAADAVQAILARIP